MDIFTICMSLSPLASPLDEPAMDEDYMFIDFKILGTEFDFNMPYTTSEPDSELFEALGLEDLPDQTKKRKRSSECSSEYPSDFSSECPSDSSELSNDRPKKRPRGPQLRYERKYRSNKKQRRECLLREWIIAEQKLRRCTAVRDAVPMLREGEGFTLAQRVCQLVFEEQAILQDMYEMRALIELSKGLHMLDWKRGVLIPDCKKDDIEELTERRTTFVFHWERKC